MLIDTHSHCYWGTVLPRIDEVMKSMKNHTVTHAIQIGCDIPSSEKAIELAKTYPDVFRATVGFHPADAQKHSLADIELIISELEKLILENRNLVV